MKRPVKWRVRQKCAQTLRAFVNFVGTDRNQRELICTLCCTWPTICVAQCISTMQNIPKKGFHFLQYLVEKFILSLSYFSNIENFVL